MPPATCPHCEHVARVDAADEGRILDCPTCGNSFLVDTEPPQAPRRRIGFECPYCHAGGLPLVKSRVTQTGWVVFLVLLFTVFGTLLLWVPLLLMREEYRVCRHCGMKLN